MAIDAAGRWAISERMSRAAMGCDARDLAMLSDCFKGDAQMRMRLASRHPNLVKPYRS